MSAQRKNSTKPGSLTQAFLQAASRDPEGALAHMLLSAFGITLGALMAVATKLVAAKDVKIIMLALTAGVQIRNHVTFVGREYGNIRAAYPELVIEGEREQKDIFNFGALHALGHILAHITGHELGARIISKAGSCITGEFLTDSEAGAINKEIYSRWSAADLASWQSYVSTTRTSFRPVLDEVVGGVSARAKAFADGLARPTGPSPAPAAGPGPVPARPAGA